ncbi:MAG: hypothetical protein QXD48_00540 [Candidatus Aenigmatarchaeota archaeon]
MKTDWDKWNREDAYNELISLYGETQRAYYNFVHIAHVLRELDNVRSFIEAPEQVEVVLWYHDAKYDTKEKDNEEKSAELAEQRLSRTGIKISIYLMV